jgi:ATP-dependent RNA helicase RhlE
MTFSDLGLSSALVRRCESLGFTEPTPIQKQSTPIILRGSDLIACAETGTGKTAAFLLPAIERVCDQKTPGIKILVIAPTRELVSQIEESYRELAPKKLACVSLIGGANMTRQCAALRRNPSVVIATPGRLFDHIERGTINLSTIEILVLDEADRMLDMGFLPVIKKILVKLPEKRQTLLFSATMSAPVRQLAQGFMKTPESVEVNRVNKTAQTVEQLIYPVAAASKTALLLNWLETGNYQQVLVFTRTKRGADRLAHILTARELKASRIHANRSQSQRETALLEFRQGKTRVLVATNIAARGIDIDEVSHVINYDVPEVPEDYVHRVGRTGRAGSTGQAITLVSPIEEYAMREIERLTAQSVKRVVLPEFGGTVPAAVHASATGKPGAFKKTASVRSFGSRRARR